MLTLFWSAILLIIYSYIGYPLLLRILVPIMGKEYKSQDNYSPWVTLIITVYNEEKRIKEKMLNTLELDYPHEKLEVIVSSDASTDMTESIIRQYYSERVKLIRSNERRGKEFAQRLAIDQAKGEILIFSDVSTILEKNGIRKIVSNFVDESIGCVSSEDRFIDQHGHTSGEGAYVRYEMWLRSLETKVNSVVGLSGSFFAARKVVCSNWPTNIPSDFNILLNSIRSGYCGISDPKSIGIYTNIKDVTREFDRKVRTITRGISALMANKELMDPFHYGMFSWQLISHKLMRWMVPLFLIIALTTNIFLSTKKIFYRFILFSHILFYVVVLWGGSLKEGKAVIKIPYYFIEVNRAIAVAWIRYLKGERFVTWTPSTR